MVRFQFPFVRNSILKKARDQEQAHDEIRAHVQAQGMELLIYSEKNADYDRDQLSAIILAGKLEVYHARILVTLQGTNCLPTSQQKMDSGNTSFAECVTALAYVSDSSISSVHKSEQMVHFNIFLWGIQKYDRLKPPSKLARDEIPDFGYKLKGCKLLNYNVDKDADSQYENFGASAKRPKSLADVSTKDHVTFTECLQMLWLTLSIELFNLGT